MSRPPRLRWLSWLIPRGHREEWVGDLTEEWRRGLAGRRAGFFDRMRLRMRVVASGVVGRLRSLGDWASWSGLSDTAWKREAATMPTGTREVSPLQDWTTDVRYALRGLRRNRTFTAVALLTLALGVGANTAVYSIVDGVLLRPLAYPAPKQLVLLYQSNPRTGEMLGRVSFEDLGDWRARTRALGGMAGFAPVPMILTGQGDPREVETTYVTSEFFDLLGVRAELGRALDPEDQRLARRSAVLSHRLWQTVFGGDPEVLGRAVTLTGQPYTIVGVMPADVRYPTPDTDVWIPQSLVEPNVFSNGMPTRGDRYLGAFGRLAPGSDVGAANRELTALSAELAASHPDTNRDWSAATVVPLHRSIVGDVDRALVTVLAVVGFILLIACANLANLLLARGSGRQRELAVRATLGADRGRVVRLLLTESLVLAVLGGALGLALSYPGVQAILALSADTLPRIQDVRVDLRVVGFALGLSLLTGVLFGLAPALRLAHADPQRQLGGARGSVGGEGEGLRSALVLTEVALAVLLLIGTGLMGRSFLALRGADPGFDPEHVLTATLQLNLAGVPEDEIAGFLVQRREDLLRRARELPGVESVGMINVFPLRDGAFSMEYTRADQAGAPDATRVLADTRYIDPGYIQTLRIPLIRGASLPTRLEPGEPLPVLLSESAARRLWPEENPVGRRIAVPWGESEVVGVVGDVRQIGLAQAAQPAVYFPQMVAPRLMATLVVRTSGEPSALGEEVRRIVTETDPDQPIRSIEPLEQVLSESIARERFFTLLFGLFGGLAIALAAVGVYGVLSYSVRQRAQEIGVRIALGAGTADVARLVGARGLRVVGLGMLLGALAALVLGRLLASQLYGVKPTDPVSFGFALLVLSAVTALAMWVPTRRAMRVPPHTALQG